MTARERIIRLIAGAHTPGAPETSLRKRAAVVADEILAQHLGEAADAIVAENDRKLWASKPGKHWAADLLRAMAAAPAVPAATTGGETDPAVEFAVRWPDGELTRATDREHGLRAIEIARRVEPGAALMQRSCTEWTEVQS